MTEGSKDQDRLFVRDGFRHYRRRYALAEVRWGLGVGAGLLAIGLWVAWKGRHPAADLMGDPAALLKGAPAAPAPVAALPVAPPAAGPGGGASAAADRGPLPQDLAGAGFREDKVTRFDPDNLYVKIDGRADYFKAFGFKQLHSLLLVSEKDAATTIDVEMYDHGTAANALGAYGGERAPTAKPEVTEAGLHHIDRNALYMARGPYYIRVLGSDESPQVVAELRALAERFLTAVKGEPLPWSYGLFVGGLGLDPGAVVYFPDNAFSLSFARDIWTARPGGKDSDLELFVSAKADAAAARAFADKMGKAFLELGAAAGKAAGAALVKDQFLGLISGAAAVDRWVVGVRGAADKDTAARELSRLRDALTKAPAGLKERARPAETQGGPREYD